MLISMFPIGYSVFLLKKDIYHLYYKDNSDKSSIDFNHWHCGQCYNGIEIILITGRSNGNR